MEADNTSAASGGEAHGSATTDAQSSHPPSDQASPFAPTASTSGVAALAPINAEDARERADNSLEVTVNVKFIHHDNVSLLCAPTIPILELRRKVMDVEHARASSDADDSDPQRLRLIYKGKVLKDSQTLDAYSFQDGDTIHAVFGRTQADSATVSVAPVQEQADAASSGHTQGAVRGETRDAGNEVIFRQFTIDSDPDSPDLGQLIGSVISNAFFGGAGPTASSGVASSTTTNASYATTSASTTTSAPYAVSATFSASSTAPMTSTSGVSPARAHFLAQQASTTQSRTSRAAALHDQASAIRRMMPPIDLGSMSRPPQLSDEMFDLGNAVREASDTFMALHRQLAYLSGRLLNENNLSSLERARLRMRIQQLRPVLRGASEMATSLDSLLDGSSLGWSASPASGPPPPPTTGSSAENDRPRMNRYGNGGAAADGSSIGFGTQRGRGTSTQPASNEPVDAESRARASGSLPHSLRERLRREPLPDLSERERDTAGRSAPTNEPRASLNARRERLREEMQADNQRDTAHVSGSRSSRQVAASSSSNYQHGSSATTAPAPDASRDRQLLAFQNSGPSSSVLDYLQRLSEGALSDTSGMAALSSILSETGNFLAQSEAHTRANISPPSMQPNPAPTAARGAAPSMGFTRTVPSTQAQSAPSSPPIISTTPISDLAAATLSRCVGSMDHDITEFYHLSSEYMRQMFPASQPEHEARERRKEWRVRAMSEIETKTSLCCEEPLVCRDALFSPEMDAALDAFIRECLDASFLLTDVPADSPGSPIHEAWVKIWSNVRLWVDQQPSSTGRLILSRVLVEEFRASFQYQDLARKIYDRTMACAGFEVEQNAPSAHA